MRAAFITMAILAAATQTALAVTWGKAKNLVVFGDSYTTSGWNISAGVNSPSPGYVSLSISRHADSNWPVRPLAMDEAGYKFSLPLTMLPIPRCTIWLMEGQRRAASW